MNGLYEKTINSNLSKYLEMVNNLLNSKNYRFNPISNDTPRDPGTYVIFQKNTDEILYIGQTGNLRRRLLSDHRKSNYQKKKNSMFRIHLVEYLETDDEDQISRFVERECYYKFIRIDKNRRRLEGFATALLDPKLNPDS